MPLIGGEKKMNAVTFFSILSISFLFGAEASEKKILESLPATNYIKYESISLDHRSKLLLDECNITLINPFINLNRINQSTFLVHCDNGKKINLSAKLGGKVKSLVAKHPIKRKTRLDNKNTETKWLPLDNVRGKPITDNIEGGLYLTTRNLAKNQPINLKYIDIAPTIKRGWVVKSLAKISNISIYVEVQALESGSRGEIIKVKNLSSGDLFFAQIINSTTVTIK